MSITEKSKYVRRLQVGAITLLIISLTSLSGCTKESDDTTIIKGLVEAEEAYEYLNEEVSGIDDATLTSIVSSNQMGIELMQELAKDNPEENLLLSPTSLAFALAMVQNGAEGETKSGILKVLGEEETGINERYNTLMNYLNSLDADEEPDVPGIKMKVANSLWIKEELEPKQNFVNILNSFYNAQVYRQDFSDEITVDNMNLWVENQTNHMLKETIDQIAPETIAYLMNTVYFKGTWINEFAEIATNEEEFIKAGGEPILTDMMHKTETLPYYEDELCQMTSMSYYGGSSMVVFLPKGNFDEFLSTAKYDYLQNMIDIGENEYQRLELSFPKFDYEARNDLKQLLMEKGMDKAFSPNDAEFRKMVEIKNENVYISSIFQNARIILDERGTEAAAVTVVEMGATSMPSEPIVFKCDKPFLYTITDNETGAVLFIGIVKEP